MVTTRDVLVHEERMRTFLAEAEMTRMARLVTGSAPAPSGLQSLWLGLGRLFGGASQSVPAEMRSQQCAEPCC